MAITRPNQVWAMDITYIPMERGFVYLAVVLDWATRRVLSWRLSITMEAAFCVETLHDRQIGVRHRARQIVDAAAADLQNFRLSCDRQFVLTVNHRFALSNPALVSAPSKKLCAALRSPCGIETVCARLPTGRERPIRFWWHVTPLKNMVHGLLRT